MPLRTEKLLRLPLQTSSGHCHAHSDSDPTDAQTIQGGLQKFSGPLPRCYCAKVPMRTKLLLARQRDGQCHGYDD
eukprot:42217-Amphidinium_carterae.1